MDKLIFFIEGCQLMNLNRKKLENNSKQKRLVNYLTTEDYSIIFINIEINK